MKNLTFIFLCFVFAGCQFNQNSTQSIGDAPGNEVEIGKKALRFTETNKVDSLVNLFDKDAMVNASTMKHFIETWKPIFNYYIFPDKSDIRISKTISKGTGGTQEFISVTYPYTDGTNSPTKDFVITFQKEKIVRMELQESRIIKIF
jgi:hypothetical protein